MTLNLPERFTRPAKQLEGLPASFQHGTRSCYVKGCRCERCRKANTAYYHQRQALGKERAAELAPVDAGPRDQTWTAPDGSKRTRAYKRACPGVDGSPCRLKAHLRKDSKNGVCRHCRARLAWNGLVDATMTVRHLSYLSDYYGIGYKAAADAAGVARSVVFKIVSGKRTRIRRETAEKLRAVDHKMQADGAIIDGRETWERIRWILARGYTRGEIAQRLGAKRAALQLRRKVLARTALKVARLRDQVERETANLSGTRPCPDCETRHKPDQRLELIRRMLPATAAEIVACWPCIYDVDGGDQLVQQDLRAAAVRRRA